jgi:hypothetical protein
MVVSVAPFAAVVHRQKRIVAGFRDAGATNADRAATPASLGIDEGLAFRTLLRHGILRDAGAQRLWLDDAKWVAHQQRRRRIAVLVPSIVLAGFALTAAIVWLVTRGRPAPSPLRRVAGPWAGRRRITARGW